VASDGEEKAEDTEARGCGCPLIVVVPESDVGKGDLESVGRGVFKEKKRLNPSGVSGTKHNMRKKSGESGGGGDEGKKQLSGQLASGDRGGRK